MNDSTPLTLCEAFQRTAAIAPDSVALRTPGDAQTVTWRAYADQVRSVAAGLAALGVKRGDTVALMMANRVEFYPLEVGAQHVGATSFSVYNTLTGEPLRHVLDNADVKVVMCEAQYVEVIRASGAEIAHLICIDGAPEGTLSVDELVARGHDIDFDFEKSWGAVEPDDVLTLIYTSGTTGNPKGVEITHTGLLFGMRAMGDLAGLEYGDRMVSFLPSAHIGDRFTALYTQEYWGTVVTVIEDFRKIAEALPDARPTIFGTVPRVWEKMKAGIDSRVENEPSPVKRAVAQWALALAHRKGAVEVAERRLGCWEATQFELADRLVLGKLRAQLGLNNTKWVVSGSAPIPVEILAFFRGLGLPIAEVWGMSELGAFATAVEAGRGRLGTVGKILPGMEYRIANDGEFLVRGPLVMKGYRREPEKTAEAIDSDGWLHTGDIMTVDADGYVRVVDRKKDLIISSNGKNMSPANIENTIKAAAPLIGSMVTIGDGRSFNTALISLDPEFAAEFAARRRLTNTTEVAAHPNVISDLAAGIAEGNTKLMPVEQIKRFLVLPECWEPGGDELTLTMKVKRRPITVKYAEQIERLYADKPDSAVHIPTPRN